MTNDKLLTVFNSDVVTKKLMELKEKESNNNEEKISKQYDLMEKYIGRNVPNNMSRDEIIKSKIEIQKTILNDHPNFFKIITYETLRFLSIAHDKTKNNETAFLMNTTIGVIYGIVETLKWEEKYFFIYDHILNYTISMLYREIERREQK